MYIPCPLFDAEIEERDAKKHISYGYGDGYGYGYGYGKSPRGYGYGYSSYGYGKKGRWLQSDDVSSLHCNDLLTSSLHG
jgi:hypothetical protein